MKDLKPIFWLILISVLSFLPVFLMGFPVGADYQNHYRFVMPFYEELSQGNYLPGWLAESNNGFGDPRMRFYPPFLYYLLSFGTYLTRDWYYSSILVFTIITFVGITGIYLWTSQMLSKNSGVLAAFIFAFVPYHLTQFYQASLLAEYTATSFLPFAFWFVQRLSITDYAENKRRLYFDIAGLAAIFSIIVTTHLPTTIIGSLSLGLFALLLSDWKNNRKSLLYCLLAISLGLLSSSWFWVRMVTGLSWIQAGEHVSSPYYDYRNNFLFSPYSIVNLNNWFGSLVLTLTIAYLLPSIILLKPSFSPGKHLGSLGKLSSVLSDAKLQKILRTIFLISVLSIVMMTDLSRPIWIVIPKLKDIQFPYRWMAITSVLMCPLIAAALVVWTKYLKTNGLRPVTLLLTLIFLGAIGYTINEQIIGSSFLSKDVFNSRIEESRGGRSFNDWLPKDAKEVKDLIPMQGNVDAGKRPVNIIEWGTHRRLFEISAGDEEMARIRTYNFPLWQAFILNGEDKTQIPTLTESDGSVLVQIPKKRVEILFEFVEPGQTRYLIWSSILGWLLILSLLIFNGIISRFFRQTIPPTTA